MSFERPIYVHSWLICVVMSISFILKRPLSPLKISHIRLHLTASVSGNFLLQYDDSHSFNYAGADHTQHSAMVSIGLEAFFPFYSFSFQLFYIILTFIMCSTLHLFVNSLYSPPSPFFSFPTSFLYPIQGRSICTSPWLLGHRWKTLNASSHFLDCCFRCRCCFWWSTR